MADQASTVAKINAATAEAQAIGVVVLPPPVGTGVLATLAPGQARRFGTYEAVGDPDWATKSRSITVDGGSFLYGRRYGLWGGSHGQEQMNLIRLFDIDTGLWLPHDYPYQSTRWNDMRESNLDRTRGRWISDNLPLTRHGYSHLTPRGTKLFITQSFCNPDNLPEGDLPDLHAPFAIYDFPTNTWSYSARKMPWTHASGAVLDPVSQCIYVVGLTVNAGPGKLWKFDPDVDTVSADNASPAMDDSSLRYIQPVSFVHCPLDDKFYSFENGMRVRRITINRTNLMASTFELLTVTGPVPTLTRPIGYPSFNWDGKRMGGCFVSGTHYTFDPVTVTSQATSVMLEAGSAGGSLPSNDFAASDFDAQSGCYLFVQNAPSGGPRTWAYRPPYLP